MPLVDSAPCGPHFLVLVHGRAIVEITPSGQKAMNVLQGTLLPEGLLADNAAQMRATTGCEVYRVRQSEFRVVVSPTTKWLGTFNRLEKEAYSSCRAQLRSARAVRQFSRSRSKAAVSQTLIPLDRGLSDPSTPAGGGVRQQLSPDISRVWSAPDLNIQPGSLIPVTQHQLDDYFRPCTPQPIPSRQFEKALPALGMNRKVSKGPLANFDQPSAMGRCSSSPACDSRSASQVTSLERTGTKPRRGF